MKEAGSLKQDDVIKALDHAKIARGAGRSRRDGAGSASCADEHVHRAGEEWGLQDRQEPGRHRSKGVRAGDEVKTESGGAFGGTPLAHCSLHPPALNYSKAERTRGYALPFVADRVEGATPTEQS